MPLSQKELMMNSTMVNHVPFDEHVPYPDKKRELHRTGASNIFPVLLPGGYLWEFPTEIALNRIKTTDGLELGKNLTITTHPDGRLATSLVDVLTGIPDHLHGKIIKHVMQLFADKQPHLIIEPTQALFSVYQRNGDDYEVVTTGKLTKDGYTPHDDYVGKTGAVTPSGRTLIGEGPYQMTDKDPKKTFPHYILTSVAELANHPDDLPGLTKRIGLFTGLEIRAPYAQILADFNRAQLHYDAEQGNATYQALPKSLKPFMFVGELPKRKGAAWKNKG